ncbi:MAG: nuclear transport factor 2 family protein [Alphaproteobacteria bacterium]|nr:nuclear transport factor 2 family protein [Alphaproteobacteria bacterium]
MKWIALPIALALASPVYAGETPHTIVVKLFDAMRAGDGDAIRALVLPDARLDRLQPDGTIGQGTFEQWASWVDTLESGAADEQIFSVQTLSLSAELATVWAPFVVSLNGDVKGCGVNQFTLAKSNDGWRILYGIDMPTKEDCGAYRARMEADHAVQ